MHVKNNLAGKRGFCASCQGKIRIPQQSTVAAAEPTTAATEPAATQLLASTTTFTLPAATRPTTESFDLQGIAVTIALPVAPAAEPKPDPVAENPRLQWFVLPAGSSTQFGPAMGEIFLDWIAAGRVAADSLVWRQDWPEWRRAGDVLPQLVPTQMPLRAAAIDPLLGNVAPAAAPTTIVTALTAKTRRGRGNLVFWSSVALLALVAGLVPVVWYVVTQTR